MSCSDESLGTFPSDSFVSHFETSPMTQDNVLRCKKGDSSMPFSVGVGKSDFEEIRKNNYISTYHLTMPIFLV